MIIKTIRYEDFTSYKKPSMVIGFPSCSFKCCKEGKFPIEICQNFALAISGNIEISAKKLVERYLSNPITSAIVCGGLEPMDSFEDLIEFISQLRQQSEDDVIIYTGFYESEIQDKIEQLKQFTNIIIKFGRYKPNEEPHYDEVLGVKLASSNQHGKRIS